MPVRQVLRLLSALGLALAPVRAQPQHVGEVLGLSGVYLIRFDYLPPGG